MPRLEDRLKKLERDLDRIMPKAMPAVVVVDGDNWTVLCEGRELVFNSEAEAVNFCGGRDIVFVRVID